MLLGAASLDVVFRQGSALRQAAAGLERLVLSDDERQSHCDGAAFLVGYLLGLPCFCFRPDVVEALKLLREYPELLNVYKQPNAAAAAAQGVSWVSSGSGKRIGSSASGSSSSDMGSKRGGSERSLNTEAFQGQSIVPFGKESFQRLQDTTWPLLPTFSPLSAVIFVFMYACC